VPKAYVIFPDGTRVHVDVADTDEARGRGLMFRPPSARQVPRSPQPGAASAGQATFGDDDEGMLFVFDVPGRYAFWMKNVRAPLDIIWLDDRCRVIWMVQDAPPCEREPCPMYVPEADASFVLEVAGGFVRRHGVAVGAALSVSPR
jgi:uncharacterized protein